MKDFRCSSPCVQIMKISSMNLHQMNVVIAAPHYKEMRIAFAQFHVTQPFNRKKRNPLRLTEHPLSHPSTLRYQISSVVNKYTTLLQSTANCKKAFPNPTVIAYRRNASLRDLLVHSTLPHENSSGQQPAGIKRCNHPRCLTCSFLREGQTNYTFFTTNEAIKSTSRLHDNRASPHQSSPANRASPAHVIRP